MEHLDLDSRSKVPPNAFMSPPCHHAGRGCRSDALQNTRAHPLAFRGAKLDRRNAVHESVREIRIEHGIGAWLLHSASEAHSKPRRLWIALRRCDLMVGRHRPPNSMPDWRIVDDFAQSKSGLRFARVLHPRRVPLHSRSCCRSTPRTTPPLRFPLACRCDPSAPSLQADPSSLPCARQVPTPPVPVCESDQERSHSPESCDPLDPESTNGQSCERPLCWRYRR